MCFAVLIAMTLAGGRPEAQAGTVEPPRKASAPPGRVTPSRARTLGSIEPPRVVSMLPLFFVPEGQAPPTSAQKDLFRRHMVCCQERYRQLLGGRNTFRIAVDLPQVYQSRFSLAELKRPAGNPPWPGTAEIAGELLAAHRQNRYNCKYIFVVVLMNPSEDWPGGYGGCSTGAATRRAAWRSCPRTPSTGLPTSSRRCSTRSVTRWGCRMSININMI